MKWSWICRSWSRRWRAIPIPASASWPRNWAHIKLDRAYVGSCTGGKTSDFLEFARVLRGKQVVIDTFGVPGHAGNRA